MHVGADPVRHVLLDAAAERDVQHLRAAADREHRQVAVERRLHQRQLEVVPLADHARRLGMRVLAVQLRIEIRAAGEDQPVERVEHLREPGCPVGGTSSGTPPASATERTYDAGISAAGSSHCAHLAVVRYVVIPMTGRALTRA